MRIAEAEKELRQRIKALESDLQNLNVREALMIFASFYSEERCLDAHEPANDGDMLLVEWGPYGPNSSFVLTLTRQLMAKEGFDDSGIYQLKLSFSYKDLSAIATGASNWIYAPTTCREALLRVSELSFMEQLSNQSASISISMDTV